MFCSLKCFSETISWFIFFMCRLWLTGFCFTLLVVFFSVLPVSSSTFCHSVGVKRRDFMKGRAKREWFTYPPERWWENATSLDPESVGVALVRFSWSACQMIEEHLKPSSPHTSPTSPASDVFSNFLKATLSTFTPTSHRDRPDVWSWERWRCLISPLHFFSQSSHNYFCHFSCEQPSTTPWASSRRDGPKSALARYLIF